MLSGIIWVVAAAIFVATVLPLTNSVRWWIRMWEFPRLHIAVLAIVLLLIVLPLDLFFKGLLITGLLACTVYHAIRIFPYTPWATKEVVKVENAPQDERISLLSANVLMENTRHADLIRIIEREDPDVLFLMEADEVWHTALKETLKGYSFVKAHPMDNHYGLIFATRLQTISCELLFLSGDDTPTVKAVLQGPSGSKFNFIGVHPRPPVPGNDTASRDKEIKRAAQITGASDLATVCMGDFNDVAWSWTTRRFKRYGNYRDPRVGRGMLSSFDARHWFLRFPIDQMFLTEGIGLVSFERLEAFGSDHFPIKSVVTLHDQKDG
ncbi:endonuclease/exonuclease/phosphatase family protein [Roseovarius sp. Pro17]|uniref:endonuclease/exonuclease/phosphatase family protein n=1 Tax=Roseovarius sp. Pro17 TaxID=3108175 RepID=UPI002D79EADC|nr:endonuclease/exonuclease/phosphatase family protein [Roseovarius sp. Pro17]